MLGDRITRGHFEMCRCQRALIIFSLAIGTGTSRWTRMLMKMHNQQAEHVVFRGRAMIFVRVSLLGFKRTHCPSLHQDNPVFTFCAFFTFHDRKSSNTRKYHLLIKRNPLYFLGTFLHLLGKLGLLLTKYSTLEKLKILIFHLLINFSCC